jgi:hypothetical protein
MRRFLFFLFFFFVFFSFVVIKAVFPFLLLCVLYLPTSVWGRINSPTYLVPTTIALSTDCFFTFYGRAFLFFFYC